MLEVCSSGHKVASMRINEIRSYLIWERPLLGRLIFETLSMVWYGFHVGI